MGNLHVESSHTRGINDVLVHSRFESNDIITNSFSNIGFLFLHILHFK